MMRLQPHAAHSTALTTTASHPQLRDLVVCPPEDPDAVVVVCYDRIVRHSLLHNVDPIVTKLNFCPSTLAYGCGLIAVGGQLSELALRSAHPDATWSVPSRHSHTITCEFSLWSNLFLRSHQTIDSPAGSINNSIFIGPSPLLPDRPRLLVSNNDASIKIYDVAGEVPDFRAGARRRKRTRRQFNLGGSSERSLTMTPVGRAEWGGRVDATMSDSSTSYPPIRSLWLDQSTNRAEEVSNDSSSNESIEEHGTYDTGGTCRLVPLGHSRDLHFDTAINHTSVSPDGRRLVAVGDTNEIFLYDISLLGEYTFVHSFEASEDASFSSDWSQTGDKFAVASQDGYVHVYDVRYMPRSGSGPSESPPRKLATIKSTQAGPPGAIRKAKFSPGNRVDGELLAFTEHRSKVHIVDARTWDQSQIVEVLPPRNSDRVYSLGQEVPLPPPSRRPVQAEGQASGNAIASTSYGTQDVAYRRLLQGASGLFSREAIEVSQRLRERGMADNPEQEGTTATIVHSRRRPGQGRGMYEEDEEEEGDEDEEVDDEEEGEEEECPPDTSTIFIRSSAPTNVAPTLLNRFLPDPRQPSSTQTFGSAPPFPLLQPPTTTAGRSPPPGWRPGLSGYTPLSTYSTFISPGRAGSRRTGYQPTSQYFPTDSTPMDLLGLDWDEEGGRLVVATEGRVWEWNVDRRGRRCFGEVEWR
ncbi:BQ5605_C007g04627 [Microbotryum silenes-dioicae]|uniref:BQ5605_C007g04627 protein n=1 Tax=Microbotryum silenes-dioicae TaxID=796604 RepID=A0A2X0M7G4_9BASI|nr:BQ5605_C007g04627 [Microbotryum silenes-dioicae]